VKSNQILLEWDPYTFSILTEVSGVIHFKDLVDQVTLQEQVDEVTGMSQLVVIDAPDEKRQPQIEVRPDTTSRGDRKKYLMPTHAHLMVHDGDEVHAGDVLAKIRDAEAPFALRLAAFHVNNLRINQNQLRVRIFLECHVDDCDALRDTDLRRCQPNAVCRVHRLKHVVD